ncbi:MAG: hypothetical protein GWN07_09265 [Actinobacteria bacterium]|nr:hypothetical protein [Actinomycetota bacterium]NIW28716.1 hypothetical protein [Actinomycetota bacterium]NIX20004.1 hypothetical protein [Actinomycetota bacterium]NIX50056.1 hypothetical protein [Actinomycetota bacterium]
MGAEVTLERYPGLPHTIHRDQVERARNLIAALQANEPEVEPLTVNN